MPVKVKTLTFNVMIMLTFPQLNFIIVIMCSLVFIWSIPFFLYFQQRWTWDADGRSTFPSNFKTLTNAPRFCP